MKEVDVLLWLFPLKNYFNITITKCSREHTKSKNTPFIMIEYKNRVNDYAINNKKIIIGAVICLLYKILFHLYYEPYIFNHSINDFGFVEIGGSLLKVPLICLLSHLFMKKLVCNVWVIFCVFAGMELLPCLFSKPFIMNYDIIGMLIGTIGFKIVQNKFLINDEGIRDTH